MIAGTLAWLAGIVTLQLQPVLPAVSWCYLLPVSLLLAWRCRVCRWPAAALAGFLWALLQAHGTLDRELPVALEGVDLQVTGQVIGIPEREADRLRFRFEVRRLTVQGREHPAPGLVRLTWYRDPAPIKSGEHWRLTVRMKQPRGFSNPGGFDYEGWLYREGIRATGYVRPSPANGRVDSAEPAPVTVDRLRADGMGKIHQHLQGASLQGLLTALALGHRGAISHDQWEVLRRTGTSHLMAISGLHVGLVAGMIFALIRHLWSWWPAAALRLAAPRAAGCAAMLGALAYAALAGFSIPTQRALIMVAVVMGAVVLARALRPARTLFIALVLVLAWDSSAVLSVGFWLSFAAVGVILWVMVGDRPRAAAWYRWLRIQGAVTIGLFPLLAILFGQISLVAPLANLIAIPWVGWVVVPLMLMAVVLLPCSDLVAGWLLQLAHGAMAVVWWPLERLAALPLALWEVAEPPLWSVLLAAAGVLILLLPRGVPLRALGLLLLAPVVWVSSQPVIPAGGFRLTVLDVGQGLAVVVRTAKHTLIYDTGPRFGARFDTGAAVVVPYLRSLGIRRVDRLMVSHGDIDHSGGVESVLRMLEVADIRRAPEPGEAMAATHCRAGMQWKWDGVAFAVLHPANGYQDPSAENDHSCVLTVRAGAHQVLLTGDVEASAEAALLHAHPDALRADLVVVPHHGSATSSSPAFVSAVRPGLAWISAGYANRWGFPKPDVVARYREIGAQVWTTAQQGAMEITLDPQRGLIEPRQWRQVSRRYWSATTDGAEVTGAPSRD